MVREAHAVWKGGPYAGQGMVSTSSHVLDNANYAFGSLAGVEPFTTPGELLAAAIASCMSTVLATEMAKLGIKPVTVDTHAALVLDNPGEKWRILRGHLTIAAHTVVSDAKGFEQAVESARRDCPIANLLKIDLTCEARLIPLTAPTVV